MALQDWKNIIQEKRKNTPFQEYLKELVSWAPLSFFKNNWLVSMYPPNTGRVHIQKREKFDNNRDSLVKYGKEYDFTKTFFENFSELFLSIELPNLYHVGKTENCDFVDTAVNSKNSYLSIVVAWECENVHYSFMVREYSSDVLNSTYVIKNNSIIYWCSWVVNSFQIFYSRFISNSHNIWFSSNLVGCGECLFCDNLENVTYAINNRLYEKQEYFLEKEKILKEKQYFDMYFQKVSKVGNIHASKNCTGSSILASENVENGYFVNNMVNSRNVMFAGSETDWGECYDIFIGGKGTKNNYWVVNFWWFPENVYCSSHVWFSSQIYYSMFCSDCMFCFWCIWLINKQYCIFNTQYTKEDWEKMVERIFEKMSKEPHPNALLARNGETALWAFFPWWMNPFYFNDSFAYLFWDFEKETVVKEWFLWREEGVKIDIPAWIEMVSAQELDKYEWFNEAGKWYIDESILSKAIQDYEGNYYKITQMEYDFLVKYWLPLPRIHYLHRLKSLF